MWDDDFIQVGRRWVHCTRVPEPHKPAKYSGGVSYRTYQIRICERCSSDAVCIAFHRRLQESAHYSTTRLASSPGPSRQVECSCGKYYPVDWSESYRRRRKCSFFREEREREQVGLDDSFKKAGRPPTS